MFQVTGLTAHMFFFLKNFWKNIILCILKGISLFKMHKNIFFQKTWKKFLVTPVNLVSLGSGYPKHRFVLFGLSFKPIKSILRNTEWNPTSNDSSEAKCSIQLQESGRFTNASR